MGITSEELAKLKELAEKADSVSSTNWDAYPVGAPEEGIYQVMDSADLFCGTICETERVHIADFIAAANPTTILAMIAEIERLQGREQREEGLLNAYNDMGAQMVDTNTRLDYLKFCFLRLAAIIGMERISVDANNDDLPDIVIAGVTKLKTQLNIKEGKDYTA